jgi:hypothetical protein
MPPPMRTRELLLLSPYTVPGENPFMLNDEDTAAFLNGYTALWHPAVLPLADGPPRVASPYDHEQPMQGNVYAVPESPTLVLPDDWDERVRDAGAVVFRSTPERGTTLANLRAALESASEQAGAGPEVKETWRWAFDAFPLTPAPLPLNGGEGRSGVAGVGLGSFFGLGFGYIQLLALLEAMHHGNEPRLSEFWPHVGSALAALQTGDAGTCRNCLRSAAAQLQAVREIVYPASIHFLDFCVFNVRPPHPNPPPQGGRETEGRPPPQEEREISELERALGRGTPFNLIASGSFLESLAADNPEVVAILREKVACRAAEVCGGVYAEREDALLPLESQLWSILRGLSTTKQVLGDEVHVFGRRRTSYYPEMPLVLAAVGLQRALLLAFDDAALPSFQGAVINWPSPNGQQIQAFTRVPYPAEKSTTYLHLAHYLHRTIMHDHVAAVAFLHGRQPAPAWHNDLIELARLAPVLGQWTTISGYLDEVYSPEQVGTLSGDDFQTDSLSDRIEAGVRHPVTEFAEHARLRRRLDTAWTLAAVHRSLGGQSDGCRSEGVLRDLEGQLETGGDVAEALNAALEEQARVLAERILARPASQQPGYLVLNPCAFARRLPLELPDAPGLLPVLSPLRACQMVDERVWVVAEVPALGFTWIARDPLTPNPFPRRGEGDHAREMRIRQADSRHVRNEFFEAEVDPVTGGLRGLWDHRTRANRIGQQLVFNPGSIMQAKEVRVTSSGPALGEILSEGVLVTNHGEELATFRQRFRAWLGRPVLEVRIEIFPREEPRGYPWHAYYGARFAWKDERAILIRGSHGSSDVTNHIRPSACDYLEIRQGRQSTGLYPGGLPYQQRHGARMLDVIFVTENEKMRVFELALGLDREHPIQTAQGIVTPAPLVCVSRGPPAGGPTGWLFHLDSPNLLLTSLRPAPGGANGVLARIKECGQHGGSAELRCPRPPRRAQLQNARGELLQSAETREDTVLFEVSSGDLVDLLIEF